MQFPGDRPTDYAQEFNEVISGSHEGLYGFEGIIDGMFDNNVTDFAEGARQFALHLGDSLLDLGSHN